MFIDPAEKQHGQGLQSVLLVIGIERTIKPAAQSFLDGRAYIEVPVSGVANLDQWIATTPNLRVPALGGAATNWPSRPREFQPM